ncbi:hypothetical protein D3Z51_12700 [Clostridiaceae bacterium]|nr:hypothetical protein [Clostridiaceae bacterium]RKI12211.1 hypothetical protein D7V81_12335 [bacterium 1XD21-70]
MKITEESMRRQEHPQPPSPKPAPAPKRSELEKLKAMCWKDRAWYIWNYYKVHMALALIAVLALQVVITSLYRGTFDTMLYCMVINSRSEEEIDFTALQEDFPAKQDWGKKELINAESVYITYGDNASELSYATLAKISALVFSQDLDIMIGDEETIRHFSSLNGYLDLEHGLSPELLGLVGGRLFYAPGEDGIPRAYAVDISGTPFAADTHLGQEASLLAVVSNTARRGNTDALLRYILAP